ncbi:hypothetical protein RSOLAG22IIIB_06368 [Rhizoctonia solani]|uniref:MACPF-like domain-containing protein n=1 Tax=Rhizoctonia solani TaxID=456999 RepID=A0A0K6GDY9_9AGAM|nr:hypothetical protein RSOLAG22IIIB_06368 [Rhizoctonia solani]
MNAAEIMPIDDSENNNSPPFPESTNCASSSENSHIVLPHQVASQIGGVAPFIEETSEVLSELITTHEKRESNYVHHGWSVRAIRTISPWTLSRIHSTNQQNAQGSWVTKRNLVVRRRVRVLLQDLAPAPEFVVAIEEALRQPTRFEKFQAVYRALSRWGDVVPLEIEIGSSLASTDTEANFAQLPEYLYNNVAHLSVLKTSSMIRKGAPNDAKWDDWTWTTVDGRSFMIETYRTDKTFNFDHLLSKSLQAELDELYTERLSHIPPLTIDPIFWGREIYDGTNHASRTISQVEIRIGSHIDRLSLIYMDGAIFRGGGEGGAEHTPFVLANGSSDELV